MNHFELLTEAKAYLLGWIASDGHIRASGEVVICIHARDRHILQQLQTIVPGSVSTSPIRKLSTYRFNSIASLSELCSLLGIQPGKKAYTVQFPAFGNPAMDRAFLRGLFDGDGHITQDKYGRPACGITSSSSQMRGTIKTLVPYPCTESGIHLTWTGVNALDFLGYLYEDATLRLGRKYDKYLEVASWVPGLHGNGYAGMIDGFRWMKCDPMGVAPSKSNVSDSGYDLTLIAERKQIGRVMLYGTGVKVQPAYGWYFDMAPRSSIIKSGYILANSFGVIDRTYTGEVIVPLIKIDSDARPLQLPNRMVQLIPRPIIHAEFVEVKSFEATNRGDGGFGSTGLIGDFHGKTNTN